MQLVSSLSRIRCSERAINQTDMRVLHGGTTQLQKVDKDQIPSIINAEG